MAERAELKQNRFLGSIAHLGHAFLLSAVCATINRAVLFYSMADDMRSAMRAGRCKRMDRTFEAVKDVTLAV